MSAPTPLAAQNSDILAAYAVGGTKQAAACTHLRHQKCICGGSHGLEPLDSRQAEYLNTSDSCVVQATALHAPR